MKLATYFHTLKYLKFSQIYFRVIKRFVRPTPRYVVGDPAKLSGEWVVHRLYEQKLFPGAVVKFLNDSGRIDCKASWNGDEHSKLWLYNLHYFDDLNAEGAESRAELQVSFINRWVEENAASQGNGWEPYPTSLRIVNWIKALLSGLPRDQSMLDSLAQQSDYLSQDLERHLCGNHLFSNAKALIFAGLYFEGGDAENWLEAGLDIYGRELDEQVLVDGGNFELTPMYHIIMLVDLLDLANVFAAYPAKVSVGLVRKTKNVAKKMLEWLHAMSHDDGEISFFNDTAFKIAPNNACAFEYARKLAIRPVLTRPSVKVPVRLFDLKDSGYVAVKSPEYSLIADLASIGPDYIPGHGHADTLSFEFSLSGQRVFVNSGISEYGLGKERLRQRKTAAHNTVSINQLDSSQVWSGFRVAKRARVIDRVVERIAGDKVSFSASHNGFKQQGVNCVHSRHWVVGERELTVTDKLIGHYDIAVGYLHLHPSVEVVALQGGEVILKAGIYDIHLCVVGGGVAVVDGTWHPQFNTSIATNVLEIQFETNRVSVDVQWSKH